MAAYTQRQNGILSWAEEDRPREKLLQKGKAQLTNAELIAILIGSGTKTLSAVDLAKQILKEFDNDLDKLALQSVQDLTKFKGIGEAKAISIVSALELGRRRKATQQKKMPITSSNDAFEIILPHIMDLQHEEFWLLLLNRANQVIKKEKISSGGVSGTVADPKIIFNKAIGNLASAIILVHNHPSGNLKPSASDTSLTKKLVEGGKVLEIPILDHLIVTNNNYFSFADESLI